MLSVAGTAIWHWPVWVAAFVRDIGLLLAAVMAGTLLHEKLLRYETVKIVADELEGKLDDRMPRVKAILDDANAAVVETLESKLAARPTVR